MEGILVGSFTYLDLFLLYGDIVLRDCESAHRSEWIDKFNRFTEQKEGSSLDIFVSEQEDMRNWAVGSFL